MGAFEFQQATKDIELSGIFSASAPCFGPNDTLWTGVINAGSDTLDLTIYNLGLEWSVSGAASSSGFTTINNGMIYPSDTLWVILGTGFNFSSYGNYNISATVYNTFWDQIAVNNETNVTINVDTPVVEIKNPHPCPNSTVELSVGGFNGNVQWQKNEGNGWINIPGAVNHLLIDPVGTDTIEYRFMFCQLSYSDSVQIIPRSFSVTGATACAGDSATLTASSTVPGVSFSWYDSPSGGIPLENNSSFSTIALNTTTYYVEPDLGAPLTKIGSGTFSNSTTSYPAPFGNFYDGARNQLLYTAQELLAAGLSPGWISKLAFNVIALNGTAPLQNFTIKIKATSTPSLTSHETGVTTQIFGPVNYMPTLGQNAFTFSAPYYWNGIDNIVIETCFTNPGNTYTYNASTESTIGLPFTASRVFRADNNMNVCVTQTDLTYTQRPNIYFETSDPCPGPRIPVVLTINPKPVADAGQDTTFCSGSSTIIGGTPSGSGGSGNLSYLWSPSSGLNSTTISNPIASPNNTTTYNLLITDSEGCSDSSQIKITVGPLPTVIANGNKTTICRGESVVLHGTGASHYNWTQGIDNYVSFFPDSTKTYILTGTNLWGCSNNDSITIIVNQLPFVEANANPQNVCSGDEVVFSGGGSGTGGLSFIWDKGVINNIPFLPSETDTYIVTGTDANGCSNTDSVSVIVFDLPDVTALADNIEICEGDTANLYATGAITYSWTPDKNNSVLNESTNFTVTGTDHNGCSNTDEIFITVNKLPMVSAIASSTEVCQGSEVTLTGLGANSYSWNNNVENNQPFYPTATSKYIVKGTDLNGCSDSFEISVIVNPLPDVKLPGFKTVCVDDGAFTLTGGIPPNGNYYFTGLSATQFNPALADTGNHIITYIYENDKGCSDTATNTIRVEACTGIANFKGGNLIISIYPNPTNGNFTLQINAPEQVEAEIILYNSTGQVVEKEKPVLLEGENKLYFNGVNYARGIYFMSIVTKEKLVHKKIVIN